MRMVHAHGLSHAIVCMYAAAAAITTTTTTTTTTTIINIYIYVIEWLYESEENIGK